MYNFIPDIFFEFLIRFSKATNHMRLSLVDKQAVFVPSKLIFTYFVIEYRVILR